MSDQTTGATGIRPYGPGKYANQLDAYVHEVGNEDDELALDDGWYGLMRNGRTIFQDHDPNLDGLTDEEAETLTNSAGCIVHEDNFGFVNIEYFITTEELEAAWQTLTQQWVGECQQ